MRGRSPQDSLLRTHFPNSSALMTPELEIIQLHRGRPPEERHRHLHLPLVGQDLLDGAVEVAERPLGDLDRLADEEGDLLLRTGIGLGLALAEEAVDLVLAQGHRLAAGADELDDALDRVDDVLRLLAQPHLHDHVARVELPLHRDLLAVLDLDDILRRDQGLGDELLPLGARIVGDPALEEGAHLVLVPGRRLDRVPAILRHRRAHRASEAMPSTRISVSTLSTRPIATPRRSEPMTTARVDWISSGRAGQVTLSISWRESTT